MAEDSDDKSQSPEATGQAGSEGDQLRSELEKLKSEQLYLRAEFDNYRKQAIKERSDLMKFGSERLVMQILDVLDNFDRALEIKVTPENYQTFVDGIRLTAQELNVALERFGVSSVTPVGEKFDPLLHEALSSETTTAHPPGHVSKVFRKGYKLHDRVIRPAQVVVAQEPVAASRPSDDDTLSLDVDGDHPGES